MAALTDATGVVNDLVLLENADSNAVVDILAKRHKTCE